MYNTTDRCFCHDPLVKPDQNPLSWEHLINPTRATGIETTRMHYDGDESQ